MWDNIIKTLAVSPLDWTWDRWVGLAIGALIGRYLYMLAQAKGWVQ